MVKEEKTIDGFSVRKAKDSKLVTRSKAEKLAQPAKKTAPKKPASKPARKATPAKKKAVKKTRPVKIEIADEVRETKVDTRLEEELFGKREEAHEDFLAPVESFDLGEEDKGGTSEGRLEEVDDAEVIEMKNEKKTKRELKKAEKAAKKERKALAKQKKAEKKSKGKLVVKIVLAILLIAIIGGGVYLYFWGNDLIKKLTGGEGSVWSAIGAMTSETYEPLKTDANGRTNILLYGTSGFDASGTGYGGGTHDGSSLTDSIMILSLDQETGDIAMVSLPRDLKAGYTCTSTGKVNEVYWCATFKYDKPLTIEQEAEGANALQAKIQEILGIETQYFVHMNWGALVSIVDTLGGITITLDEDINDYNWTGAVYEAGVEYTIGGEQALGLARARHGTQYGDFTRGNSQQKILIGIKNKVVEKGLSLTDALTILNALGDNLRSNLDMEAMKTGMHLLETFDLDSMRQIPLVGDAYYMTTANIGGISYVIPSEGADRYTKLQEYIARMLKSNPAEREGAELLVLNGTGEAGVAATERERLEKRGYTIKAIDDAPEGEYAYTEDIEIYDTSEGLKPETKKALEDFYGVEMKDMAELPNGISPVGYDFIIIIGDSSIEE
ncbi:LCP family protein [Candidatus Saccharibacteria bacterium]|nr:LCP family protein [Candidatus Saccharibacteria bacterium]